MIKLKKKFLLTLLPLATVSVAAPIILTSCSSTSSTSSTSTKVGQKSFNAISKKINGSTSTKDVDARIDDAFLVDPNINSDAMRLAKETFQKKLTIDTFQKDFDRVLSKFYQIVDFEYDDGQTETEAELLKVEVMDVNTSDINNMKASVKASFKVQTENGDNESNSIIQQESEIKIIPAFATQTEIDRLTALLTNEDQQLGNLEIDWEDLRELYVGDPDDNEKSIFEQVADVTKDIKFDLGGLLGYGIYVTDLAYNQGSKIKIKQSSNANSNIDLSKVKFFAPSNEIKEFFYPDIDPIIVQGMDFTISYEKTKNLTQDQLLGIKSLTSENNGSLGLNDILKTPIDSENAKKIASVLVEKSPATSVDSEGDLIVTVTLNENVNLDGVSGISIFQFGISHEWYKYVQNTTPAPAQTI